MATWRALQVLLCLFYGLIAVAIGPASGQEASCTGGVTLTSTLATCRQPSEYNGNSGNPIPTPVYRPAEPTGPAATTAAAATKPPVEPIRIIPGLAWHVFTGSTLGWPSSVQGVRATAYPWILDKWTQPLARRLQYGYLYSASAICYGNKDLRCAYRRQIIQTTLTGKSYVTTREAADFTAYSHNYTASVFKSEAEVNTSYGVNGSEILLKDTAELGIYVQNYSAQYSIKVELEVDIMLPVYRTRNYSDPTPFMTSYYTNTTHKQHVYERAGTDITGYFGRQACVCFAMLRLHYMPDVAWSILEQLRAQASHSIGSGGGGPRIDYQKTCGGLGMWFGLFVGCLAGSLVGLVILVINCFCMSKHKHKRSGWACCGSGCIHHRSVMSVFCRTMLRCGWVLGCHCQCMRHSQSEMTIDIGRSTLGCCWRRVCVAKCFRACMCFAWCRGEGCCECCSWCRGKEVKEATRIQQAVLANEAYNRGRLGGSATTQASMLSASTLSSKRVCSAKQVAPMEMGAVRASVTSSSSASVKALFQHPASRTPAQHNAVTRRTMLRASASTPEAPVTAQPKDKKKRQRSAVTTQPTSAKSRSAMDASASSADYASMDVIDVSTLPKPKDQQSTRRSAWGESKPGTDADSESEKPASARVINSRSSGVRFDTMHVEELSDLDEESFGTPVRRTRGEDKKPRESLEDDDTVYEDF